MDSQTKPRTISELAALLGVSSMTVHRAIAGKPDISAKTRERILAEIERLGWRPNIAARGLRQGKTFTLGILVSNMVASFLPDILHGVNQTAEEQGYHTFVSAHENDVARAERHLHTLESKGVDGIVHFPTTSGGEGPVLNQVLRSTPIVVIMRQAAGFEGPTLLVDDHYGGLLAARHLLRLGHRRIGFLGYRDSGFSRFRREGLEQGLAEAGLAPRPEWTVTDLVLGDDLGRQAVARILTLPERPTALFCAGDRLAALTIQAASALGIKVPQELSVVGYNDDLWVELLTTPLTTIAQPKCEIGVLAARMVLDGAAPEHVPAENGRSDRTGANGENGASGTAHALDEAGRAYGTVLKPWLVERESSGPAPAG